MKRICKNIIYVVTVILAIAGSVHLASIYGRPALSAFLEEYERTCYTLWCIAFVLTFCKLTARIWRVWKKIAVASLISLAFAVTVFLINNMWRYMYFNYALYLCAPTPFWMVMKWDITYTRGLGEFRYPLAFATMLAICVILTLIKHFNIPEKVGYCIDNLSEQLYLKSLKKENLADVYFQALEDSDRERLEDYVENMTLTDYNKEAFMELIDFKDDDYLIFLFLKRFGNLLTKKEFLKYKNMYKKLGQKRIDEYREYYNNAEVIFPEVFGKLDDKFGVTEED